MKNTKIITCMILSVIIGIIVTTPLLVAELNVKPWIEQAQGPTVPFNSKVVYINYTIANPDEPITQISGPTIDYYAVINVTNPSSDYRAILSSIYFSAAQEVQSTNKTLSEYLNSTVSGEGGEAKGAWVDGIYYNVTWTIPYPHFNIDGTMIQEPIPNSTEENFTGYYQWKEGVQYYKRTVRNDTVTNTYTYLNMNGTWVDVTGRIIIDQTEPDHKPVYSITGTINTNNMNYLNGYRGYHSGLPKANDDMDSYLFASGETRLLVISGSFDLRLPSLSGEVHTINYQSEGYVSIVYHSGEASPWDVGGEYWINPVDVIQSGIIQTYTHTKSIVDIDPTPKDNIFINTFADTIEVQELTLTQVGNSYIYNAVLSDNQMFQFDQYGLEAFIVPRS
jgi:hypothetical protein